MLGIETCERQSLGSQLKMFDSLAHLELRNDINSQLTPLLDDAKTAGVSRVAVLVEDFAKTFDPQVHRKVVTEILQRSRNENIKIDLGLQPKNIKLVESLSKSAIAQSGYSILKFHSRDLGCDENSFQDYLRQMFDLCRDINTVLYVCTYRYSAGNTLNQAQMEQELQRVSELDRSVKIVLTHGFTTGILQASELVRSNENLFLDLSWTLQKYAESSLRQDIKWLMRNLDQKLIFGTDWPENSFIKSVETLNELMAEAAIEKSKKDNFLWNNAEKLFDNG